MNQIKTLPNNLNPLPPSPCNISKSKGQRTHFALLFYGLYMSGSDILSTRKEVLFALFYDVAVLYLAMTSRVYNRLTLMREKDFISDSDNPQNWCRHLQNRKKIKVFFCLERIPLVVNVSSRNKARLAKCNSRHV